MFSPVRLVINTEPPVSISTISTAGDSYSFSVFMSVHFYSFRHEHIKRNTILRCGKPEETLAGQDSRTGAQPPEFQTVTPYACVLWGAGIRCNVLIIKGLLGSVWDEMKRGAESEHLPALEDPEDHADGDAHQEKNDHPCPI